MPRYVRSQGQTGLSTDVAERSDSDPKRAFARAVIQSRDFIKLSATDNRSLSAEGGAKLMNRAGKNPGCRSRSVRSGDDFHRL
jgi:hypothetical protein